MHSGVYAYRYCIGDPDGLAQNSIILGHAMHACMLFLPALQMAQTFVSD